MRRTYIFNTTIVPNPGLYMDEIITEMAAQIVLAGAGEVVSAIGHDSTAQLASTVLGREVPVNRIPATMQIGDSAVCIKLRGRAPEGAILDRAQVEAIGYDLHLLQRLDPMAITVRGRICA